MNFLFTASADRFVTGWDMITGEQSKLVVKCDTAPYSIVFAENFLWIGLSSGDIHVIDVLENREVKYFKQHKSSVFSIYFLKSKNLVLTTDSTGLISVWDNNSLTLEASFPIDCGKIRKINSNEDESLLLIPAQNGEIRILETNTFNEIIQLKGHKEGSNAAKFSTDQSQVYSVGKDGHLKIWDWQNDKLINSLPIHLSSVYDLIIYENSIITASRDKSIKIWDSNKLQIEQKISKPGKGHAHSVNGLVKLIDGFASYSDDKSCKIWKTKSL
jgi:WD40 repeat protein